MVALVSFCFNSLLIGESSAQKLFRLVKIVSTIQYGYRKCGTPARVFSQTPSHVIASMKIKKQTEKVRRDA